MNKLFRKTERLDEASQKAAQRATPVDAVPSQAVVHDGLPDSWYVPQGGNPNRFVGGNGLPTLRLISYRDTGGEHVLRLCEDGTGLLVGPTDRRLPRAGIYVSQLRGEAHHEAECRAGNFYPGEPVRLVREPENPYDRNAVAVYDATGKYMAAYVNKQKARTLAKLIDSGAEIEAISIRGTRSGVGCDQVAILAASPDVLRHVLSPRPAGAPRPAHER
ncbi:HIRAN domain-containing protein [Micromonospora sp. 4G55]|uniref:HIRAN domain-containing protein n=1 Tax=Micromonospora sp. 4G55 TaxID=2806102 RepID=UPI001A51AF1F|nr:HIRAN domain-containing protein [Micromonospora sp. 4G55]MBM0255576.1 HIRAN domain-containing protein [Micromonospora sp. 4G55]